MAGIKFYFTRCLQDIKILFLRLYTYVIYRFLKTFTIIVRNVAVRKLAFSSPQLFRSLHKIGLIGIAYVKILPSPKCI
jgi:hypothetical protein